ncbi:hypothetical protein GCM10017567_59300 [Amycolatopsis bullii]|uniref:Uncharacterized protein n=1 Tax=Amycolatopsis bullii TaxID=941987 RepID=A0ABQ3KMM4_9PSEU|nr:hypothetical protein GCM10017567_59300 [Amycolatopsis bullii]
MWPVLAGAAGTDARALTVDVMMFEAPWLCFPSGPPATAVRYERRKTPRARPNRTHANHRCASDGRYRRS